LKHLYVLRHAKAVSAGDADDDFARELSPSGHADATRLGEWLAQRDHRPDMVLCSPARRTVETWQDVSQAWQGSAQTEFPKALYLASAAAILAALRKAVPDSLMVIGHNPGLENLALHLVRRPQTEKDRERTRKLAEGMPTCALAIFDFAIASWKEVARRDGELTAFVRPKDLKQ
jgi:phosphohistidine phosphatase